MDCTRDYLFTCEELFEKIKSLYSETFSTQGQLTKIKVDDMEQSFATNKPMSQADKKATLKNLVSIYEDMGCGNIALPKESNKQFYKGRRTWFNG